MKCERMLFILYHLYAPLHNWPTCKSKRLRSAEAPSSKRASSAPGASRSDSSRDLFLAIVILCETTVLGPTRHGPSRCARFCNLGGFAGDGVVDVMHSLDLPLGKLHTCFPRACLLSSRPAGHSFNRCQGDALLPVRGLGIDGTGTNCYIVLCGRHHVLVLLSCTSFDQLLRHCHGAPGASGTMGWSEEVHARRTLDVKEQVRQQSAAGQYAVPELIGNSSLLSLVTVTGTLDWYPHLFPS